MSVIPTVYNQGTGLIGSTTAGTTVPENVDNLIVNQNLLVGGTGTFNGAVTVNNTLTVTGTISFGDVDITGTFTVVSMTASGFVLVAGDITTTSKLQGNTIVSDTTITAGTTINAGTTITAGANITANTGIITGNSLISNTNISAGGNITASGIITGNSIVSNTSITATDVTIDNNLQFEETNPVNPAVGAQNRIIFNNIGTIEARRSSIATGRKPQLQFRNNNVSGIDFQIELNEDNNYYNTPTGGCHCFYINTVRVAELIESTNQSNFFLREGRLFYNTVTNDFNLGNDEVQNTTLGNLGFMLQMKPDGTIQYLADGTGTGNGGGVGHRFYTRESGGNLERLRITNTQVQLKQADLNMGDREILFSCGSIFCESTNDLYIAMKGMGVNGEQVSAWADGRVRLRCWDEASGSRTILFQHTTVSPYTTTSLMEMFNNRIENYVPIVTTGGIGGSVTGVFTLPTSAPGGNNWLLRVLDSTANPPTTEWYNPGSGASFAYVDYDTSSNQLQHVVPGASAVDIHRIRVNEFIYAQLYVLTGNLYLTNAGQNGILYCTNQTNGLMTTKNTFRFDDTVETLYVTNLSGSRLSVVDINAIGIIDSEEFRCRNLGAIFYRNSPGTTTPLSFDLKADVASGSQIQLLTSGGIHFETSNASQIFLFSHRVGSTVTDSLEISSTLIDAKVPFQTVGITNTSVPLTTTDLDVTGTLKMAIQGTTSTNNDRLVFINNTTGILETKANFYYAPGVETLVALKFGNSYTENMVSAQHTVFDTHNNGLNNGSLVIDATYGLRFDHPDGYLFRRGPNWKLLIGSTTTTSYNNLLISSAGQQGHLTVDGDVTLNTAQISSADRNMNVLFHDNGTGDKRIKEKDTFYFNPSSNILTTPNLTVGSAATPYLSTVPLVTTVHNFLRLDNVVTSTTSEDMPLLVRSEVDNNVYKTTPASTWYNASTDTLRANKLTVGADNLTYNAQVPTTLGAREFLLLNSNNIIKKADSSLTYDPSTKEFTVDTVVSQDLFAINALKYGGTVFATPCNATYIIGLTDSLEVVDSIFTNNHGYWGDAGRYEAYYLSILRTGVPTRAFGANVDFWTWNAYATATNTYTTWTCGSVITGLWHIRITLDFRNYGPNNSDRWNPIIKMEKNGTVLNRGYQSVYSRWNGGRVTTVVLDLKESFALNDTFALPTFINVNTGLNFTNQITPSQYTMGNFLMQMTFLGPLTEYDRTPE